LREIDESMAGTTYSYLGRELVEDRSRGSLFR